MNAGIKKHACKCLHMPANLCRHYHVFAGIFFECLQASRPTGKSIAGILCRHAGILYIID